MAALLTKFLTNLRTVAWAALAAGLLLLIWYAPQRDYAFGDAAVLEAGLRWLHVLCGIMWIGLLYYFNFVQIPNMAKIPDEQKPAIGKVIAPAALFWFRWAAMGTMIFGVLLAGAKGYIAQALSFNLIAGPFEPAFASFIGLGMWLALIMWFNVWFVIWPNQQRALNINNKHPDLDAAAKAAAGKTAMLFSRTNTLLSVPMLVAMTGAQTLG